MALESGHETVLEGEAVHHLMTSSRGQYVDCTYGRGGHTRRLLAALSAEGRVLAMDRDLAAVEHAKASLKDDPRVRVVHAQFGELDRCLADHGIEQVHGVLMDLGVSSPQLDEAHRGLSFHRDGPLDMRMDRSTGMTVAEFLARAEERELADVLWRYGEERFSRRIARGIVKHRSQETISGTLQLAEIIISSIPRKERNKHPATRSFQALRIYINDELGELERCLAAIVKVLVPGGRMVVISFHSLEDRMVKRFMRDMSKGQLPDGLPIRDEEVPRVLRIVGKPMKPSDAEIGRNRRARSAVMRVAEKVGEMVA
ncbi:MAG: 16S rRNA (cytosine(1402)-N(4))-methyltransferase [Gammaproteobacteria bacterium]|uniref:Ribosomal RNA small subunit methyltransferase H n=1 Tax=OM182 bacterium MED-G24 TaxID=1986255 RepID=A0A2A5WSD3_9GAMM|nr:16S rRNA (cytosine(1402)-N(4))-methyltransferase [Gammaproteobacteria bacterium]PDH39046.1 MAG: 16S rRNA (cytosine(1402)-N(4))-methyltransferase [OM182 bacterium MED-G24]RPG27608.1 MAG: 16S rRNA (cytosine(1402)-N(4))-methyltransferase RsmH [Gammaproteobacteria bacterium TMED50]|tara:strand:+ start:4416 stop:5357 length:942 start_codon:yes stop_codon:yes gene_type:complete